MPVRFFDLQVNGYAGVDFNREGLSADDVQRACGLLGEHGAEGVLATVITDGIESMCRKLKQLATLARDAGGRHTVENWYGQRAEWTIEAVARLESSE